MFLAAACLAVALPATRAIPHDQVSDSPPTPCTQNFSVAEIEFEDEMDRLSFQLYQDGILPNLAVAGHLTASNAKGRAAARIAEFIAATMDTPSTQLETENTWDKEHVKKGRRQEHTGLLNSSSVSSNDTWTTKSGRYCPHHIPANSPYWQQTEPYHETHPGYVKCEFSDGCKRRITNGERVTSIRNALHGTTSLLRHLGIDYMLNAGSAIGQWRCGDVIPWDLDCDVLVSRANIERIHRFVYKSELNWYTIGQEQGMNSGDLSGFGAPGMVLSKKTACTPLEVVDTRHGFFCDIFPFEWRKSTVETPWWKGTSTCPGSFPACAMAQGQPAGAGSKCYVSPTDMVAPIKSCKMAGEWHRCPAKIYPFLVSRYGPGINKPNRTVFTGHSAAKPAESTQRAQPANKRGHVLFLADDSREGGDGDPRKDVTQRVQLPHPPGQVWSINWDALCQPPVVVFLLMLLAGAGFVLMQPHCLGLDTWDTKVVFVLFVLFYAASSTLTAMIKDIGPAPSMLVLAVLVSKLVLSFGLWMAHDGTLSELAVATMQHSHVLVAYSGLALLFAFGDWLRLDFIQKTNPSTFHVLVNFRIVMLALVWQLVMARRLRWWHWLSVLCICLGCLLKELPHFSMDWTALLSDQGVAYLELLLMFACSSVALVVNEKLLQSQMQIPLNLQNLALYLFGIGWMLLVMLFMEAITSSPLLEVEQWQRLCHPLVVVQILAFMCLGVTVSHFLKRLSNVTREIAVGVVVLITVPSDAVLFGVPVGPFEICGSAAVLVGVCFFAQWPIDGRLEQAKNLSAENASTNQKPDSENGMHQKL